MIDLHKLMGERAAVIPCLMPPNTPLDGLARAIGLACFDLVGTPHYLWVLPPYRGMPKVQFRIELLNPLAMYNWMGLVQSNDLYYVKFRDSAIIIDMWNTLQQRYPLLTAEAMRLIY